MGSRIPNWAKAAHHRAGLPLGLGAWDFDAATLGARPVTANTERRVAALERTLQPAAPSALPVVLPEGATDAELDALRRRGLDAYLETDPDFIDLFV